MALHYVYNLSYEAVDLFEQAVAGLDEANPAHHPALGYALVLLGYYMRNRTQGTEEVIKFIQQG
jgi:hypothetical protein